MKKFIQKCKDLMCLFLGCRLYCIPLGDSWFSRCERCGEEHEITLRFNQMLKIQKKISEENIND